MPYDSISELPEQTSSLTDKEKRAYMKAYNSSDDQDEESRHRIAWSAAKKAGDRSEETSKHYMGLHDQDDHDPTKGARAVSSAGSKAKGFTEEATAKELTQIGAYGGMAAAAATIARQYYSGSPKLGAAYGVYAIANAVMAGLTAKDVGGRVSKAVEVEEPTKKVINAISRKLDVDGKRLLEDLGEWLIEQDIPPKDITPTTIKTFLEDYEVNKRVTPEMAAMYLSGELAT